MKHILNTGLSLGLDNEIFQLSKYSKGWSELNINDKYKTKENFETYCYLKYSGLDSEQYFKEKIMKLVLTT